MFRVFVDRNLLLQDMITHIVIWKYKADIESAVREEHVAMLRGLAKVIPDLESLQVGVDVLGLPRSYDTGLVATYKDRAAFDAYTVHPEHIKAADFGRNISAHVASVDFETP
jgi:Stress responsive A/B Barrel Domain